MDKKYFDRRDMLNNKAIRYLLNKYRDDMMIIENAYRKYLKGELK